MIELHAQAREELRQAQAWYRTKSLRTATRFFEAVLKAMEKILADPEASPVVSGEFRYVRVFRFPFILAYRVRSQDRIQVVAVAHTSRRPGYWRRRR